MSEIAANLGTMVLATGALGTAAFGVVDGLKTWRIGLSGYDQLRGTMGDSLFDALEKAYGAKTEEILQAQYRNGRKAGTLPKTLRRGVRIGLTTENAEKIGNELGTVDGRDLNSAAEMALSGALAAEEEDEKKKKEKERNREVIARFELAADARIDAALSLAEAKYKGLMRVYASITSIAFALIAAFLINYEGTAAGAELKFDGLLYLQALIVGIAAVPIAPVAKDIAKSLQSATKALKATR